ncbi:toxic anion resistance protein [Planococcus sp. N028]|uniref:Toxic anion resistance protein n=1 Tax=Planococcus shixiaomingii TaxID=3058393 RepID=A0ABT8N293_9BACL|nr:MULTISPECIES: toxic anion resistance protein [unclassified Planococcus (in: firmicutes)]MDN7241989.1 toxic anion resistance protein [Planococcus sp. N028]WKA54270.1 toxic anion resistance protein [Planococcus sp. N022]
MNTLPDQMEQQELVMKEDNELLTKLKQDPEVLKLAASIDIKNQVELLEFGREPANEISAFTGKVLSSVQANSMEESSELLNQLGKIMDKFDKKDFVEKKGLINKVFNRGNKIIEKLFSKYQTMGTEIDKVYVEITKYESEMKKSTTTLEELYDQNFRYFMELEKYIAAGDVRIQELKAEEPAMRLKAETGDQLAMMQLTTLQNAIELLEQRVYDLEMAKQVSYQSAPQIRMLQRGNTKLIGKINSAFVTTIPIFKTGLINAIAAKRQNLVAQSMNELDRRTNEMLIKNANDISRQSVDIARMSGQPSIKIETIEQTWETIMKGMNDTREIEQENRRMREEGRLRIEELQKKYEETQRKA